MEQPSIRIASVVHDSADPRGLAEFYRRLLGWTIGVNEPPRPGQPPEDGWLILRAPDGTGGLTSISFQYDPAYVPPVWPTTPPNQAMMLHLDLAVQDLDAAVAWAREAGAVLAEFQPQDDVRVMLDPAGHPFCLFRG